jgi:hypothetical protein
MSTAMPAFALAFKRRRQNQHQSKGSADDDDVRISNQNLENDPIRSSMIRPFKSRQSLPQPSRPVYEDDDPLTDASPLSSESDRRSVGEDPTDDFGSDHLSVGMPPVDAATRSDQSSMRVMNSELQRQVHELQLQNRSLQQKNREMTSELTILKSENTRLAQVSKQLAAAQREIAELSQVLRSKEASISALDEAYDKLEADYKHLLDSRSIDADGIAAKQMEINRLQQELDQCKFNRRLDDEPPIARFRAQKEEQPLPPQQPPRREIPAAMRVNLCFGADDSLARVAKQIPVEDMSDGELKDRFESLSKEKEDKERQLNRAPPKGSNLAHVRRQKEELDNEVVKLGSLLSKVKLEMKRRGIY